MNPSEDISIASHKQKSMEVRMHETPQGAKISKVLNYTPIINN